MSVPSTETGVVIIGAGPAGLAPLFAAANVGRLHEILKLGVTVLERGHSLGSGELGTYAIASDSSAEAILDIVLPTREPGFDALRTHATTRALLALGKASAPLSLVGEFLQVAGSCLCDLVARSPRGQVITGAYAQSVQRTSSGTWRTRFRDACTGSEAEIVSTSVLIASGAHQPAERLERELVAGHPLFPRYAGKVWQSGQVLRAGGASSVAKRLRGKADPRVAIVGGSTSAVSVALRLLKLPDVSFGNDGVTLLHRRPLRLLYDSVQEARAEGYTEFSDSDVCALTGRVFRLSGFRLDSRELIMRARGIGGCPREPRLALFPLRPDNHAAAHALLERADLIVAALGYTPRMLPICDEQMHHIPMQTPTVDRWAVVDGRCRLLIEAGTPLPGLFGLGLAVGPAASPELGGETGYKGQVNSLWLWQHTLGLRIVDGIEARCQSRRAAQLRDAAMAVERLGALRHSSSDVTGLGGAA